MWSFLKASITLIHVVNRCIWPGQIPSGNAICPTCSNKYSGKTQHPSRCQSDGEFSFEDQWDVKHTFLTNSWMATHDTMYSPVLCHSLLVTSPGKIEIFALKSSPLYSARVTGLLLFYTRLFAFWLFPLSRPSDSVVSYNTGRRVLYKWSPLDFQFAVLWLLQAAAVL